MVTPAVSMSLTVTVRDDGLPTVYPVPGLRVTVTDPPSSSTRSRMVRMCGRLLVAALSVIVLSPAWPAPSTPPVCVTV